MNNATTDFIKAARSALYQAQIELQINDTREPRINKAIHILEELLNTVENPDTLVVFTVFKD